MPINDNYQQEQYIADGSITEFDFSFPVIEPKDIKVFVQDTENNIEEKAFNSDYTVNLNSNYSGKIIFTTAPSLNYKIFIQRETDITQKSNYKTSSGFQAEEITNNLDKLTIICQEQQSSIDKSLKISSFTNVDINSFEEPQDGKCVVWKKNLDGTFSGTNSINNPDEVYSDIVENEDVKNVSNNINNINTIANNINNVDTVVSNITDLNNVATNIEAVSSISDWINTSGGTVNYYVGQIISILCSSSYVPFGCLACDGSEYSKEQFVNLWNNYLTATTPLLQTCTYEEYQTSITNNGFCEKFAVDNVNNKFKVPTLNNVMYQNTDTTLPVVGNGKTISVTDGTTNVGLYISSNSNMVVSRPGLYGTDVGTADTGTSFYMHNKSIGFSEDETVSCLIAKNKANASINFFVVVASGEINQSQMDWSAWVTSLQGKANTDLNNLTTTGKELIYTAGAPNYANKTNIIFNVEYTASSNGYVYLYGTEASNVRYYLTINGIIFEWDNTAAAGASSFTLMPIAKNDIYKVTSSSGAINNYKGYFIPVKTI